MTRPSDWYTTDQKISFLVRKGYVVEDFTFTFNVYERGEHTPEKETKTVKAVYKHPVSKDPFCKPDEIYFRYGYDLKHDTWINNAFNKVLLESLINIVDLRE